MMLMNLTFPFVNYTSGSVKKLVKTTIKNITKVDNAIYKGYISTRVIYLYFMVLRKIITYLNNYNHEISIGLLQ